MKIQILLATVLIFNGLSKNLTTTATAQRIFSKGQITKTDGSTLDGEILDASFEQLSKTVVFRSRDGEQEQIFQPADLQSFKILNGQFFESHKIEYLVGDTDGRQKRRSEQRFLHLLEGGGMRLFKFHRNDFDYILYVGKRGGGDLQRLDMVVNRLESTSSSGRKNILGSDTVTVSRDLPRGSYDFRRRYFGVLQILFADCPAALMRDAPELNDDEILAVVRRYNKNCSTQPAAAPVKPPKRRLLLANIGSNFPGIGDDQNFYWQSGGVGFQFGNLMKSKRNTFELLLNYNFVESSTEDELTKFGEIAIRSNMLFLQSQRLTPHVSLGLSYFFNPASTPNLIKYNLGIGGYYFFTRDNFVRLEYRPHLIDKNLRFQGFAAAVGFKI